MNRADLDKAFTPVPFPRTNRGRAPWLRQTEPEISASRVVGFVRGNVPVIRAHKIQKAIDRRARWLAAKETQ